MASPLQVAVVAAAFVFCGCPQRPGAADAGAVVPAAAPAPPSPFQLISEVEGYLAAGDVDAAAARARALVDDWPRRALHHNLHGRVLMQRYEQTHDAKDAQAAVEALQRAVELDPRFPPAHENLAKLAERRGLLEDAIAHYEALLRLSPAHPARERLEALRRARPDK